MIISFLTFKFVSKINSHKNKPLNYGNQNN
jgi:hypothetical protein